MPAAATTLARLLARRRHARIERGDVEAVEHKVDGLYLIVPQIGDDTAECGSDARKTRHDRAFQADFFDQCAGVQRAAAAERHRGELCRIVAALDRDQTDSAGHARIGDADDRFGGLLHAKPERLADMRQDRLLGRVDIELRELAADRPRRIDAAEHDVGVGQRRPHVALAVAGRSRHRAGAFRSDL